jgi:peptidoglycan/LPS O-acetylase OafA/YrhL
MPTLSITKRNVTLDLARIFACLWVWLYHWTGNAVTWAEYDQPVNLSFSFIPTQIQDLLNRGHLGVDLFFVLSGCVIANSALQNSPIAFAKSRFTRLFPAYFIASLVTIALYGLAGGNRGILLGFYWLTGFPLIFSSRPYIGPAWTLHHEILFYFLVYLVLRFGKIKKNFKTK